MPLVTWRKNWHWFFRLFRGYLSLSINIRLIEHSFVSIGMKGQRSRVNLWEALIHKITRDQYPFISQCKQKSVLQSYSVKLTSLPFDRSNSKQEAEVLLCTVSLISNPVGYIWPRVFAKYGLLMDNTSSMHMNLYVKWNWYANCFFQAKSKDCMNSASKILIKKRHKDWFLFLKMW